MKPAEPAKDLPFAAMSVCEGVADKGVEDMTGIIFALLGSVGANFGVGMTAGFA